jgi:hypothetical protein
MNFRINQRGPMWLKSHWKHMYYCGS